METNLAPTQMTYSDTFAPVMRALAAFILAQAPQGLSRHSKTQLEYVADGHRNGDEYNGITFERTDPRAEADLYIRTDCGYTALRSANGDLYSRRKIRCELNWASYGSSDVFTAQSRIQLLAEVALFAQKIDETFGQQELFVLVSTKAEQEEATRKRMEAEDIRVMLDVAKSNSKGLKVWADNCDKARVLTLARPVPSGTYAYAIQNRTYKAIVDVIDPTYVTIHRTA